MKKILIVEDEPTLGLGLHFNLSQQGWLPLLITDGKEALEKAIQERFDLIVLDITLPNLSGFEICQELRARKITTPILMLTARAEVEDRIQGLKLGADDYLGKPFHLGEFLARVEALLRRDIQKENDSPSSEILVGQVHYLPTEMILKNNSKSIQLTAIENKLLSYLIASKGHLLSRKDLLKDVWDVHHDTQTRTVDNFILRLRHFFQTLGLEDSPIESVRGVGYRFIAPENGHEKKPSKAPNPIS